MANGNPVIGYQNYLETALSVIASSEVAGFEVENAWSGFIFDYWQPNATVTPSITVDMGADVYVDYYAMANYYTTSNSGYTKCMLSWSTDNFAASDNLVCQYRPGEDEPFFIRLPVPISARYWRFQFFTGGSLQPKIGALSFGISLQVPEGLDVSFYPPHLSMKDNVLNNDSQGGAFIGRSIQQYGSQATMQLSNMDSSWVRGEWLPFLEHARTKPFFLDWSDRWGHNLIKSSELITPQNKFWNFDTATYTTLTGTYTPSPAGDYDVEIIQLDLTNAYFRTWHLAPEGDTDSYAVRFWCKLVSGTITQAIVYSAGGASTDFTTALAASAGNWAEYTAICPSGGDVLGHILQLRFQFAAGNPRIAITQFQAAKGTIQLEYQKTDQRAEEAAYCWTDGAITPPQYSQPGRMNCSLKFKALTR